MHAPWEGWHVVPVALAAAVVGVTAREMPVASSRMRGTREGMGDMLNGTSRTKESNG